MRCVNNSFIESAEDGGRGFRLQGHFQMPDKEGKTVRERDKVQERGLENKKHGKGLKMTPFRDYQKAGNPVKFNHTASHHKKSVGHLKSVKNLQHYDRNNLNRNKCTFLKMHDEYHNYT